MGSLFKVLIFFAVIYGVWRLLSPRPLAEETPEDNLIADMVSCRVCGNYTLKKNCGQADCPYK